MFTIAKPSMSSRAASAEFTTAPATPGSNHRRSVSAPSVPFPIGAGYAATVGVSPKRNQGRRPWLIQTEQYHGVPCKATRESRTAWREPCWIGEMRQVTAYKAQRAANGAPSSGSSKTPSSLSSATLPFGTQSFGERSLQQRLQEAQCGFRLPSDLLKEIGCSHIEATYLMTKWTPDPEREPHPWEVAYSILNQEPGQSQIRHGSLWS